MEIAGKFLLWKLHFINFRIFTKLGYFRICTFSSISCSDQICWKVGMILITLFIWVAQFGSTQGGAVNFCMQKSLTELASYYNLDLLSVCLSRISSAVYRPIFTKLGMKVGDSPGKCLGALVPMANYLLSWQPKKLIFTVRSELLLVEHCLWCQLVPHFWNI